MDLEFQIDEGQKSYIEKIEIRGNTKTKDKVIRRELAVSPGELFDMVRVKLSKQRLEGLEYFEKVDTRPEADRRAEPQEPGRGRGGKEHRQRVAGRGLQLVDSLVGFAEFNQGNFDLFHPADLSPAAARNSGCGCNCRHASARITRLTFIEPWFLDRKLQLSVDLYYRDYAFLSPNSLYDEIRAGGKVSLERALGSDFLRGGVSYTLEDVGISLTSDADPTNRRRATFRRTSGTRWATTCCRARESPSLTIPATALSCPTKASAPR